ncbi:uncharacterized protein PITG_10493 [Phytophthora infestans T30-4]|uniref:Uncharacterized protein n=1 Tax=Phytophthora infestans (strain T30-4) TaxID=403677 RepID=D0NFG0_PHYIT|nr:uncharacterized protein PITG_10493 [Phytophthora infestans T30-4]EEY56949.1 hypothetical protein PITG_10493 [Phytophthora infestans T30-4]|eukprot:XP_002902277.1 hypothetical protein PITG_10493 [Phytophthora infestans T30-4]
MLFQAPAFHAAALLRHTGSPTPNATRLTHADLRCPVELLATPLETSTMPVQSPPIRLRAHVSLRAHLSLRAHISLRAHLSLRAHISFRAHISLRAYISFLHLVSQT